MQLFKNVLGFAVEATENGLAFQQGAARLLGVNVGMFDGFN